MAFTLQNTCIYFVLFTNKHSDFPGSNAMYLCLNSIGCCIYNMLFYYSKKYSKIILNNAETTKMLSNLKVSPCCVYITWNVVHWLPGHEVCVALELGTVDAEQLLQARPGLLPPGIAQPHYTIQHRLGTTEPITSITMGKMKMENSKILRKNI